LLPVRAQQLAVRLDLRLSRGLALGQPGQLMSRRAAGSVFWLVGSLWF
jgi:hypothetical protein